MCHVQVVYELHAETNVCYLNLNKMNNYEVSLLQIRVLRWATRWGRLVIFPVQIVMAPLELFSAHFSFYLLLLLLIVLL